MTCEHCREGEWTPVPCYSSGIEEPLRLEQRRLRLQTDDDSGWWIARFHHTENPADIGSHGAGPSPERAVENALELARRELICKLAWVDRQLLEYLGKRIVAEAAKTTDA